MYLEDLSTFYHPEKKSWMKTLQGLAILIQCFCGEVPLFFLSGKAGSISQNCFETNKFHANN